VQIADGIRAAKSGHPKPAGLREAAAYRDFSRLRKQKGSRAPAKAGGDAVPSRR
jgi:hypothetical protein